jgi:hypothetical protein
MSASTFTELQIEEIKSIVQTEIKNKLLEEKEKCRILYIQINDLIMNKCKYISEYIQSKINSIIYLRGINSDVLEEVKLMIHSTIKSFEEEEKLVNEYRNKLKSEYPSYDEESFYVRSSNQFSGGPLFYKAMVVIYKSKIEELKNNIYTREQILNSESKSNSSSEIKMSLIQ